LLHLRGLPTKSTPEIKQAAVKLTLQHPSFLDLQIAHFSNRVKMVREAEG
jgi:hypothetical protein